MNWKTMQKEELGNSLIKILFVGDTSYDMYVDAFYKSSLKFSDLETYLFDFKKLNTQYSKNNLILRTERHYKKGIYTSYINRKLIECVRELNPDIVFLYACDVIYGRTVRAISKMSYVAIYNNDNPFSNHYKSYVWKNVIKSIKFADQIYSYRNSNIQQYYDCGAKKVSLMRSYYIEERNYYIEDLSIDLEVPDVCFIGHYEDDGRLEYIKALTSAGIVVGLPDSWINRLTDKDNIVFLPDTIKNYNLLLNKTKIAIVFLSKINCDTYTRRCFEIPVTKTVMIAPRTEDIESLFLDGKEIVLYDGIEDFVSEIQNLLSDANKREQIADAAYCRIMRDGHEVKNRVRQIVEDYSSSKAFASKR